jgi:hypothetical protein
MFKVRDVARLAIQVNGPTGENLELRNQCTTEEQQRSDMKQRIEEERKAAAAKLTPTTLSEKLCKEAGVELWNKLSKKDTLEKFGLEWSELDDLGLAFESKTNPKNPRFKPMRLYKAGDGAKALARKQQRVQELQDQRKVAAAQQMAAKRARAAARAIGNAAEQ